MEKSLKTLLTEHGFSFKKAFGQNFLTDDNLLSDIVEKAGITENDTVLEIGPGAGALTRHIAKKAKKVICYEIDTKLKSILEDVLDGQNNVEIVFSDIMKCPIEQVEKKLGDKYVMVANLPYYITTPIVMKFIEQAKNLKAMVIMVQEEVAFRFASTAGHSDYGAITVGINLRGDAEIILRVPREKFTPAPSVDSAVIKITIDENKFKGVDFNKVREVVRIAFSSRRKMLVNNLMNGYKISRDIANEILDEADISLTDRGESLSAEKFVILSQIVAKKGIKS